ncbi:MAG: hypothetical protein ACT4PJ_15520 [Gemmatimonadaceae bacterium]
MSLTIGRDAWLLLLQAVPVDTPVVKMVASERTWFDTVTGIASGIMTLTLLALTIALVPAAWNFRKSHRKVSELLDRVYGDINPIVRHLSTIADNVDYITTSIRVDVQQVNQTIAGANQRLNHAVALAEQRLNEFNALIRVVQQEAEDTFVSTAATVRGVREGAATFRRQALEDHAFADADMMDDEPLEEELDGDDGTNDEFDDDPPGDIARPAPRIRPREGR